MSSYATVSRTPRTIAWLIRPGDWNQIFDVVRRNCAFIGGAANHLILLGEAGEVAEGCQDALNAYDPDLVAMGPDQSEESLKKHLGASTPFAVVPWEQRDSIGSPDPWSSGTGENAKIGHRAFDLLHQYHKPLIATQNPEREDNSRLAFIACGDIVSRRPMLHVIDGDEDWDAAGARENFLAKCLRAGADREALGARRDDEGKIIRPPNLAELSELIADDCKFPLDDPIDKLRAACDTSNYLSPRCWAALTLHGLTKTSYMPSLRSKAPRLAILVSETFSTTEAVLFWNLRASGRAVGWLAFRELEEEIERVAKWMDSELGGQYYAFNSNTARVWPDTSRIGFLADPSSLPRLEQLVTRLRTYRRHDYPEWNLGTYPECRLWDQPPLVLESKAALVNSAGPKCIVHFRPEQSDSSFGLSVLKIDWDDLLVPKSADIFRHLVSAETIIGLSSPVAQKVPRIRPDCHRQLRAQVYGEGDTLLQLTRPTLHSILSQMLRDGGFDKFTPSATAKYHEQFMQRSGGLEKACRYLSEEPFRRFLDLLKDNVDKKLPGWIIDCPSKRRALHHHDMLSFLGPTPPPDTKKYFDTVSDQLPTEVVELIVKGIVERGFRLRCTECSYKGWYSLEALGRQFACIRCDHHQQITANPLWLYKLSEVIFQGFEDNMQVPLLTLEFFKRKSQRSFYWLHDSNVGWNEGGRLCSGNLDLVFALDGKFIIGEAKSTDVIKADQLELYSLVARKVPIDGLVFATSRSKWGDATQRRIDSIAKSFGGELFIVTGDQLYAKP